MVKRCVYVVAFIIEWIIVWYMLKFRDEFWCFLSFFFSHMGYSCFSQLLYIKIFCFLFLTFFEQRNKLLILPKRRWKIAPSSIEKFSIQYFLLHKTNRLSFRVFYKNLQFIKINIDTQHSAQINIAFVH